MPAVGEASLGRWDLRKDSERCRSVPVSAKKLEVGILAKALKRLHAWHVRKEKKKWQGSHGDWRGE